MTSERQRSRDHVTTQFPTEYVRAREPYFSRAIGVETGGHVVTAGQRIAHRLTDMAASAACTRCPTTQDLAAGTWHAAEPGQAHGWVCDVCAQRDDASGFAMVASFRRMAAGPSIGRRAA